MDHHASRSAPPGRIWSILLGGLAILGVALAVPAVRPSLVASARSTSSDPAVAAPTSDASDLPAAPGRPAEVHRRDARPWGDDVADGAIPDGTVVGVFDEEVPAVGRLDPDVLAALQRAAEDAEADGVGLQVNSGWRSPAHQERLLHDAVVEHGSQEEAARWVATPETSAHVSGDAVDIGPSRGAAWLSEHGAAYGLCRIYRNEPWHFELRPAAADDGCPPMFADPTEDPRMAP